MRNAVNWMTTFGIGIGTGLGLGLEPVPEECREQDDHLVRRRIGAWADLGIALVGLG